MALTFDDSGSKGIGLSSITITGDTYIVDEFTPDTPVNEFDTIDQDGNVNGGFGTTGANTATAVLQKPATETTALAIGAETSSYEGATWIVTGVNLPKKVAEQHRYQVKLRKKYN